MINSYKCTCTGITIWIHKWKKNGWKASTGANVINRDDFETLDDVINGINIEWVSIKRYLMCYLHEN